jgi:hypothetical protein
MGRNQPNRQGAARGALEFSGLAMDSRVCHCEERSDAAIQKATSEDWIASSQGLLAMTIMSRVVIPTSIKANHWC